MYSSATYNILESDEELLENLKSECLNGADTTYYTVKDGIDRTITSSTVIIKDWNKL